MTQHKVGLPDSLQGADSVKRARFQWACDEHWRNSKRPSGIVYPLEEHVGNPRRERHGFGFWFLRDGVWIAVEVWRGPRGGLYENSAKWDGSFDYCYQWIWGNVVDLTELIGQLQEAQNHPQQNQSQEELLRQSRGFSTRQISKETLLPLLQQAVEDSLEKYLTMSSDVFRSHINTLEWESDSMGGVFRGGLVNPR